MTMSDTADVIAKLKTLAAEGGLVWCAVPGAEPELVAGIERRLVDDAVKQWQAMPAWRARMVRKSVGSAIRRAARRADKLSQADSNGLATDMALLLAYEALYGDPTPMLREQPPKVDYSRYAN